MEEDSHEGPPMFYCGAQVTTDGDYLPSSFSVFPNSVPHEHAVQVILDKISDELMELDITKADGAISLQPICCWGAWADIKLDDEVKTRALLASMTDSFLTTMIMSGERIAPLLKHIWSGND